MISEPLEKMLIRFSAPTLMGIKAASLLSVDRTKIPELFRNVALCNRIFNKLGLRFAILCECNNRNLLYVYRPALLAEQLQKPECAELLERYGYPVQDRLGKMLLHLRSRIALCRSFQHEIGLFLDYPIDDVVAFIEKLGADCKLCGYWKVYCDVERAKACFAQYDACRDYLMDCNARGYSISNLLLAG